MRTLTQKDIDDMLQDGNLDFSEAEIRDAIFCGKDLEGADFANSTLCNVVFGHCNMSRAVFNGAICGPSTQFVHSVCVCAEFRKVTFKRYLATFSHCYAAPAFLQCGLTSAQFNGMTGPVYFRLCNMRDVNFDDADLTQAKVNQDCGHVFLHRAKMRGNENLYPLLADRPPHDPTLPEDCREIFGDHTDAHRVLTGWRYIVGDDGRMYLAQMLIPAAAHKVNGLSAECRADKVMVQCLYDKDGNMIEQVKHRTPYEYSEKQYVLWEKGEVVQADKWDANRWNPYGDGIRFYMTQQDAEKASVNEIF